MIAASHHGPLTAQQIVAAYAALFPAAMTAAPAAAALKHAQAQGGKHALILPPHPDDECLMGLLALRLRREAGWRVTVAAASFGSLEARQEARRAELRAACHVLGFELVETPLAGIGSAGEMAALLELAAPDLLIVPHAADWHPTHERTHVLALAGITLRQNPAKPLLIAETEYWQPMREPSLLLGASAKDAALLVEALMQHRGEVARNPYHLTFPALLLDSVRRGAERVGGKGATAPDFAFGQLYRLSRWEQDRLTPLDLGAVSPCATLALG